MALHHIECPHCLNTYAINDQQYRANDGMVQCGTCQERFQTHVHNNSNNNARFDPRIAFANIKNEERDLNDAPAAIETSHAEFNLNQERNDVRAEKTESNEQKKHLKPQALNLPVRENDDANGGISNSDSLEASKETSKETSKEASKLSHDPNNLKRVEPTIGLKPQTSHESKHSLEARPSATPQDNLIDEVDSLVNDKLLLSKWTKSEADSKLLISGEQRKSSIWSKFVALLLLIVVGALIILFTYQLWMKQIITFDEDSLIQKKIVAFSTPIAHKLEEMGFTLPVRRNLSQLTLASASTQAHPTRLSTVLLKVEILNRANISQPLPWLEMSLTDADGGLVSLRNLSPDDYIYNNKTNTRIGPQELKKITIELLSFPIKATGYELKLLNR